MLSKDNICYSITLFQGERGFLNNELPASRAHLQFSRLPTMVYEDIWRMFMNDNWLKVAVCALLKVWVLE